MERARMKRGFALGHPTNPNGSGLPERARSLAYHPRTA